APRTIEIRGGVFAPGQSGATGHIPLGIAQGTHNVSVGYGNFGVTSSVTVGPKDGDKNPHTEKQQPKDDHFGNVSLSRLLPAGPDGEVGPFIRADEVPDVGADIVRGGDEQP